MTIIQDNNDELCDICDISDCIIKIPNCNHKFHIHCIQKWPINNCPKCDNDVEGVALIHPIEYNDMDIKLRTGKWSYQEMNYVNMLISEFKLGRLCCGDGTTIIRLLSKCLNCSPMRLSKKFQRNAIASIIITNNINYIINNHLLLINIFFNKY